MKPSVTPRHGDNPSASPISSPQDGIHEMSSRTGSHTFGIGSNEHGQSHRHQASHPQAPQGNTEEEDDDVIYVTTKKVRNGPNLEETATAPTGRERRGMHSDLGTLKNRDAGFKKMADRKLTKGTRMTEASQEEDSDDDVIEIGFTPKGKGKAKLQRVLKNGNDVCVDEKDNGRESKAKGLVQSLFHSKKCFALTRRCHYTDIDYHDLDDDDGFMGYSTLPADNKAPVFVTFDTRKQMSLKTLINNESTHIQFAHVELDGNLVKKLKDSGFTRKESRPEKDELKKYLLDRRSM